MILWVKKSQIRIHFAQLDSRMPARRILIALNALNEKFKMWNLSLCSILQFLVTFSASEQIFPTTAALHTHTHTHTPTQPHRQNIIDTKSKQSLTNIFLFHLTAMTIILQCHFSRFITNFITFRP